MAVARALGDAAFKSVGVISKPEIRTERIDGETDFLILACDGVWDVVGSQEAVDVVRSSLNQYADLERASNELTSHALVAGSTDNITVVVIQFAENA